LDVIPSDCILPGGRAADLPAAAGSSIGVEVLNDAAGRPIVHLHGPCAARAWDHGLLSMAVSISHTSLQSRTPSRRGAQTRRPRPGATDA
jgi:hypothetical protein